MNTPTKQPFTSLDHAATHLGLPTAWLKAEALAGRLPHLKVGRRILVHVPTVEKSLQERAEEAVTE